MIDIQVREEHLPIRTPIGLANAIGDYLLVVDANGKAEPGTEIPDVVYARFERARELLFIDTRVFTALGLQDTIKDWREKPFYCGVLQKRLASGSGKTVRGFNSVCFDLSENPEGRTDPIRPRRGRPLKIERIKARVAMNEEVDNTQAKVHEALERLRAELGDTELWPDIQHIADWAEKMLSEASRLLMRGKKPGPAKGSRRPRKVVLLEDRIHVKAVDDFLQANVKRLHRIMRKTMDVNGRPKLVEKEVRPECDPDEWIGRYEDVVDNDGRQTQQLFIPVALLRHDEELKVYAHDYRYVRQVYRRIGRQTAYCAAFNMARPKP